MGTKVADARSAYIGAHLDRPSWQKLASAVEEYRPDFIVLLARKMARLWQVLDLSRQSDRLAKISVYSDFALDFMGGEDLAGKKVAVIDDAINVGSTITHVCEMLAGRDARPECYIMASKDTFNKASFKWPIHIMGSEKALNEDEYRKRSAKLNMALLLSTMPLEIEYPSYKITLNHDLTAEQFANRLERATGPRFQWLTNIEAEERGMLRAVLLMEDRYSVRAKIRLYIDMENNEVVCSPMPFCKPAQAGGDRENRRSLYRAGKKLMGAQWEMFRKAGAVRYEQNMADARLLFGSDSNSGKAVFDGNRDACHVPTSYMLDALFGCQSFLQNIVENKRTAGLRMLVVQLFRSLAYIVGEDDPQGRDQSFISSLPESVQLYLDKDEFARLRLGLSFDDIISIIKVLSPEYANKDSLLLSRSISRLLDEHIDQGYIVPVIDLAGRRAFRKGEPWPHDRAFLYSLQCQGKDAKPGDNLEEVFQSMSPARQRRCLALLKEIEEMEI